MVTRTKQPISTQDATSSLFTVFRFMGIDNLNRTWGYILYSLQLNFASCIFQSMGFTASYVISSKGMTTGTFLTSLQVVINVYAIVPKILIIYFSLPRLRETGIIFDKLDAKIQSNEEREVAQTMISFCKRLVLIYMISYFGYSVSTCVPAIVSGHPPYSIYIPYIHWQDSLVKMIIASLIEFHLMNVSCFQDVGLDVYPVIYIYIARMHMKILCIRVEQLGRDPTKSKEENLEMLKECIDTHRTILDLIELVRPIISKTLFIQLIATTAVMGITLVNIMLFADLSSAVASLFFLVAVTLETLPLCYTMNVLMEEIQTLPTSIFHSEWFSQDRTFRRMALFFIQNAQRFRNIIAGNFLPIEVATFVGIAKLAFSIYALVSKMADRRATRSELE